MKTKEIWYDEEADVLNIEINDKDYWKSIELPNGIVVDISKDGSMTGFEILNASSQFLGESKEIIKKAKPVSSV